MFIKNIGIYVVDIGYTFTLLLIVSFAILLSTEKLIGPVNETIPTWLLLLETIGIFWIFGILIFIVDKLMEKIPFPLHGVNGYDHKDIVDKFSWVFIVIFLTCAINIPNRLILLHNRLTGLNYNLYKTIKQ